jgi:DNA-binding transcriptional regulator LsrR (DeoR family)
MDANSDWEDLRTQEAAYLKAQFRWSQKEIATALNLSQSKVSRLLKRAKDKNWLQTHFVPVGISPLRQEEIRCLFQPQRLLDTLQAFNTESGIRIRNVRSFDSGSGNPQDIGARLRKFGLAAAARLEELLLNDIETFGVTFGETVTRVVDGLGNLHSPSRREPPIQFLPVCAELVRHAVFEFSSTRLAYRLREIINEGEGESVSLGGLPAYLPRAFFECKTKARAGRLVEELLSNNATYRKNFLGQNPLVQRLDGLLTSVGPSERALALPSQ